MPISPPFDESGRRKKKIFFLMHGGNFMQTHNGLTFKVEKDKRTRGNSQL
jgi:hypothetical protein